MVLAPNLTSNLAKVLYRQKERNDAADVYVNNRTAENKALYEEELHKASRYVLHQQLVYFGIPFAILLFVEGIGFYYLFWHERRS